MLISSLLVYPNPVTNGVLTVQVQKPGVLRIFTNNGQLLWNKKLDAPGRYTIGTHGFSKGIYRLSFNNEVIPVILQ